MKSAVRVVKCYPIHLTLLLCGALDGGVERPPVDGPNLAVGVFEGGYVGISDILFGTTGATVGANVGTGVGHAFSKQSSSCKGFHAPSSSHSVGFAAMPLSQRQSRERDRMPLLHETEHWDHALGL